MQEEPRLEIDQLTGAGLAAALQLQEPLRWNQTENDWRRLLKLTAPGCFAARVDGRLVGTVTTISYGTELAWIGMMLVHSDFRRRGIGTRLMQAAMDHLQRAGMSTIKLDATPAGQPVYESLGFLPEILIERWEGVAQPPSPHDTAVWDKHARPAVYALDRVAFGADRMELLDSLIQDSAVPPLLVLAADGQLRGYALARRGSRAFYLGPLVASDESTAAALLDGVLHTLAGEKLFLDFHTGFGTGSHLLAERGLTKQRDLLRMRYGTPSGAGASNLVFAIAGPELG